MSQTVEPHAGHGHAPNRFAVPSTPERFADEGRLRGRGVTIAFLDSGFHPHPDIAKPDGRILAYHDVHDPAAVLEAQAEPAADAWHGTQTCVAAAGNGSLSDGVYRGLASEASLALVRVGREGRISDEAIERGLEWVLGPSGAVRHPGRQHVARRRRRPDPLGEPDQSTGREGGGSRDGARRRRRQLRLRAVSTRYCRRQPRPR